MGERDRRWITAYLWNCNWCCGMLYWDPAKIKTNRTPKSPNWDSAQEPLATTGLKVSDGKIKKLNINQIYHHKWLFVKDDYKGFNVDDSVKRSLAWLPLRKEDKIKNVKWSSIGRQKAWNTVVPHIPKDWIKSLITAIN